MDKIKVAKELVKLAKSLVANDIEVKAEENIESYFSINDLIK